MARRAPVLAVILGGALLVALVAVPRLRPRPTLGPMQPNFGFIFAYGACGAPDRLDTFHGTLTRSLSPLPHANPSRTIRLILTHGELQRIYQEMARIDLFGYPETYSVDVPFLWRLFHSVGTVCPAMTYRFLVHNGRQTKRLSWLDDVTAPTSEQAERLRGLIALVQHTMWARPAVRQLPRPQFGCL